VLESNLNIEKGNEEFIFFIIAIEIYFAQWSLFNFKVVNFIFKFLH